MKTAISIPNNLFKNAEKTAKKMGITRSSLFSHAIEKYLEDHSQTHITKKLNSIYSQIGSKLDSNIIKMQVQTIQKENW